MTESHDKTTSEITLFLHEYANGDKKALDRLFPVIYNELQSGAHRLRQQFFNMNTLNTTAIVHEAYMKLIQAGSLDVKSRSHFFFIAARAMRQILVNASIRKSTLQRGENPHMVDVEEVENNIRLSDRTSEDLLLLNDALKKLEMQDERQAQIVECRFFGGMTIEETATALDISPATVKRSWNLAKAWLYVELNEQ
jgi:RNA polymerase sigma factor (TIGR02999 family)